MFSFGIIGAGEIAHRFCDGVRRVEGAQVAAVSSKSAEKAAKFAADENIPAHYGSYDEMLAKGGLDAVYIATTHNFHLENALLCLDAGLPVLIEKAMACSRKDAEQIFSLAREKSLFVMEATWSRFLPAINKAREWIANGEIGHPLTASCMVGFKPPSDPALRWFNPALGGGTMYDVGVYAIELTAHILNRPVRSAHATAIYGESGTDIADQITLVYDDCVASLLISFAVDMPMLTVIYGTAGRIELPQVISCTECTLFREGEPEERFSHPEENGFTYQIEETMRCVRAGLLESPVIPHADTLMCAGIFDMALRPDR